ncbi:restriction endonuclease subunit S [Thioalkalivibrio sp. ALJ9]|uniref:restriction endonuclease subunit S n=1 Tax=Thioalkalivibrio sp. ALJ9 TaxID=1158758 RepID=UPI00037E7FF5|nr:restriction endonuclease subunit S [Thioalkalivibrio sp. ALJ9]
MSARDLITEHLDLWTGAITSKSTAGRGRNGKIELTGINKLRELILELAVRGRLVEQDPNDEPASVLLQRIAEEKARLEQEGNIKRPRHLPPIDITETPFSIPNNWQYTRLNEIGCWGSGATPKRSNEAYYGGSIPWFKSGELRSDFIFSSEERITDLAVRETSVRMNNPGDVLVAMYGATIGKAAILGTQATTNQAVCACTPWRGISNRFLLLTLKSYRPRFIRMGAGGAQPNISREKIISTVIGLPPESEQCRIVEKVDELMALCDRLEQQVGDQLEAHEVLVDTLLDALTRVTDAGEVATHLARIAEHFDTLFTTESSIDKLKKVILQLAVMGRLVGQDPNDEPASVLLERIAEEKARLVKEGKIKKPKKLPEITEEEKPFELPSAWEWGRLTDVYYSVSSSGRNIKKSEISGEGSFPVVDQGQSHIAGYHNDESLVIRIPHPVVVFGDHTTARKYIDFDFIAGADGTKILCPTIVDPKYFHLHLLQYDLENRGYARHFKILNEQLFAVPPLHEQRQIVEKIDELMALCDQLKARLGEARETRFQLAEAVVEQALN